MPLSINKAARRLAERVASTATFAMGVSLLRVDVEVFADTLQKRSCQPPTPRPPSPIVVRPLSQLEALKGKTPPLFPFS
jgi:hypothetical protein